MLQKNALRKEVTQDLSVIRADATDIPLMLKYYFHRAIISTPCDMDHFLYIVPHVVMPEGMIHFYTFKKKHQIEDITADHESKGLKVLNCRRCGNVAPGVSRWVFDMSLYQNYKYYFSECYCGDMNGIQRTL
ncbi:hypothetical protein [uncultured Methanomethylovorans sp.]|uniref:hypothetical protein n=1 Tax=uncultured Methanomethylovorans sp. TaxID=183759 RepID=UPI002AA89A1C|nr:hypothetical protein [uncultured Methanomethylovorans sp.]